MAAYVIYSNIAKQFDPVGILVGDAFHCGTMSSIDPFSNKIHLRLLRPEDRNHPHLLQLKKKKTYFTLNVFGKFDIGSIMGFSGLNCFHFTRKSCFVLYLTPRIFAGGEEKHLDKSCYKFLVYGDVRLMMDRNICNIYLLRGYIYEDGKFVVQNQDTILKLNMLNSDEPFCDIVAKPNETEKVQPNINASKPNLTYVGYVTNPTLNQCKPIALISGVLHQAPNDPYPFGNDTAQFEVIMMPLIEPAIRTQLNHSSSSLTIIPEQNARTFIYSNLGQGFFIGKNSNIIINGCCIIVDDNSGNIINRYDGNHYRLVQKFGQLKVYIRNDHITLLDNRTGNYQIVNK